MQRLALAAVIASFFVSPSSVTAQSPQPKAPPPAVPTPAETITPSKDFPKGTATPSAECGACHQAIASTP